MAVGRGIQNYTCATSSSIPVALGAIATLFDATSLAYTNINALNAIPPTVVYLPVPSNELFTASGMFPVLGHHFFDSASTPSFVFTNGKALYAGKTGDIKAPATADKGPMGTGAVDWLSLVKKATYTSNGLSEVYRVETAGGMQETNCTVAGVMSIPYSALYWFFQ